MFVAQIGGQPAYTDQFVQRERGAIDEGLRKRNLRAAEQQCAGERQAGQVNQGFFHVTSGRLRPLLL